MAKKCPRCGAELREDAAFCPHCAESINQRTVQEPPKPRPVKAIRAAVALALIAAIALGVWLYTRPKTYDAGEAAELTYTDSDGTYQILLNVSGDRFAPLYWVDLPSEEDQKFRIPTRLYVTHGESGANAKEVFLKKIDSAQVEIIQPEDCPSPMACTAPAPHDALPEATLISLLDYRVETGPVDLVWTLHMKNGDTIVLRQHLDIYPIETYNYYAEDTPMDTIEDLQALVTEIERTVDPEATVNIYLPAVTYEGGLVLSSHAVNLYGRTEGEARTVFTSTTQVTSSQSPIFYFYDIDFIGDGSGVGISASARVHLNGCYVSGWRTGLLCYGEWANTQNTTFENNEVAFHFNSGAGIPSTYHYTGTRFVGNGTGVLLERVPSDQTLIFNDCLFSRNGTDIDNRCEQAVDITTAVFE